MSDEKEVNDALREAAKRRTASALALRQAAEKAVLELVEQLEPGDELPAHGTVSGVFRVERVTWLVSRWAGGQQPRLHPTGALTLVLSNPGHAATVLADVRQDYVDQDAQVVEHVAGESFFRHFGLASETIDPLKLASDATLVMFSRQLQQLRVAARRLATISGDTMRGAADRIGEDS